MGGNIDATSSPKKKSKRLKPWWVGVVGFLCLAGYLYYTSVVRISENFDVVDPGRFYRSAQLTPNELVEVVNKYGIKTVISLRGAPENSYWVKPETDILAYLGVKFIAAGWTSDYFPDRENFLVFAKALKEEQYPILVHCRTGADRTGEASAIYSMEFLKQSKEEAIAKNLNFKHWHVKAFHPAMSEFIRRWKGIDTMIQSYDACSPEYRDFAENCPNK